MKRYNIDTEPITPTKNHILQENTSGEWVKYEDVYFMIQILKGFDEWFGSHSIPKIGMLDLLQRTRDIVEDFDEID